MNFAIPKVSYSAIGIMHYLIFLFLFSFTIFAQSTTQFYKSKTFTSTDGLANNIVSSIAQDKKGFLWIGTYGGLNRYDGREFRTYTMADGLEFDAVRTVFVDDETDEVWVGTEIGLSILKNGEILKGEEQKAFQNFFKGKDIRAINKTDSGIFLVGTEKGLFKIENVQLENPKEINFSENIFVQSILIAQDQKVWIGTKKNGIFILDKTLLLNPQNMNQASRINGEVISIVQEASQEKKVIVSFKDAGLYEFSADGDLSKYTLAKDFPQRSRFIICLSQIHNSRLYISSLSSSYFIENIGKRKKEIKNANSCFIDKEGTFWVGTYGSGLTKLYRRRVISHKKKSGLVDTNIRYIFKDSINRVWLGTQTNITKYEKGKFSQQNHPDKNKTISRVRAILEDDEKRVWFGTEQGLFYLNKGDLSLQEYTDSGTEANKSESVNIYSMDKFGDFLFTLDKTQKVRKINLKNLNDKTKKIIDPNRGQEVFWRITRGLADNNLYLQSSHRILKLEGEVFKELRNTNYYNERKQIKNKKLNKIQAFLPISENHFVIGDDHLIIEKDGKIVNELTQEDGLPKGQIVSIIQDSDNKENFWMGTSKGLIYYKGNSSENSKGEIIVYDRNDGLAGDFCNFNSIAVDEKYAFIGMSEGLSMIDRTKDFKNNFPVNVFFTKVKINKRDPIYNRNIPKLAHDENTIQLDAASLSLVAPENNEYKFIHNGVVDDSPYEKNGSKVYYNLPHGKHTFQVSGKNNDDVMSMEPKDEITIEIKPPFWLNPFYYIPIILFCFGLIYAVYTFRVYRIQQENIKLEKLVQQRTIELSAEKEISENLLLNILPKNIAQRLKNGESNIADSFAQVTVLFADIVGFTKLSQTITPWELVAKLNDLFSRFDKISVEMKVEKIKTIGDCYMVVAGLPEVRNDHAKLMIEVAKQMLSAIEEFNKTFNTDISIRIGINTGEVIAGVIGTHKFIYDLWGDSVNTASRMESHGIPGKIHVTENTYQLLKNEYQFESRGVMEIKGKGKMETYLLKT